MKDITSDRFENDVKTYSIQTIDYSDTEAVKFENDVKTYSIQTELDTSDDAISLRMM